MAGHGPLDLVLILLYFRCCFHGIVSLRFFKNIPCARLATEPIKVTNCVRVENAYDLFKDYVKQGKMKIGHFEDKSKHETVLFVLQYIFPILAAFLIL